MFNSWSVLFLLPCDLHIIFPLSFLSLVLLRFASVSSALIEPPVFILFATIFHKQNFNFSVPFGSVRFVGWCCNMQAMHLDVVFFFYALSLSLSIKQNELCAMINCVSMRLIQWNISSIFIYKNICQQKYADILSCLRLFFSSIVWMWVFFPRSTNESLS